MILAFIMISIILIIITDGSWWARYTPYIYALPILAISMFAMKKSKLEKIIAILLLLLMFVNMSLIANNSFKDYILKNSTITSEMKKIKEINKKNGKVRIALKTTGFASVVYNLKDLNVDIELVNKESQLNNKKYVNYFYYENN